MEKSSKSVQPAYGIIPKIYRKDRFRRYFSLLAGLLLISIAFNLFLLPNNIVFGGVSGISIITKKIFGWNPSAVISIGSFLLLIVSFLVLGKNETTGSILGSLLFPVFVQITENIGEWIPIGEIETLLAVLFGAVIYGLGSGLIFKAGFTTG
ncbi:MAG: YitT family protein, partial [Bacilli bacterium]|nr:YitT family protein [Bacilli bacterium]